MSVIKQISVYNGSSWNTDDIGADASNVTLSSNIAGSTNLNTALSNILPASQLTASRALISDANKKIVASDITSTQLGYLSGVTSNIQTQINEKAPTSHASTTTTYGRASQDYYGHAKINNTLTVSTHQAGVGLSAYQGYLLNQNKQAKGNYVTFNNGIKNANFSYDSNSTHQTLKLYNELPDGRKRLFLTSEGNSHSISYYNTNTSPATMLWQLGSLPNGKTVHIGDQSTLPSSGSSIIQNIVNINNNVNKIGTSESILAFGVHDTVGTSYTLSKPITNFKYLLVRCGSSTDQAKGGGSFTRFIPVNVIAISSSTASASFHGDLYNVNGDIYAIDYYFPTSTQVKIFHACKWQSGQTSSASTTKAGGSGIRSIIGYY